MSSIRHVYFVRRKFRIQRPQRPRDFWHSSWSRIFKVWDSKGCSFRRLCDAYYGICFQDDDVEKVDHKKKTIKTTEVRKVLNVECATKQRPSQHVLVTQLVGCETQETLEPYCVNDAFFQMIENCAGNYNANQKLITDEREV